MPEGNILTETALRLRNMATQLLNAGTTNVEAYDEEMGRVRQTIIFQEIAKKASENPNLLNADEVRYAKMLQYASLARKTPEEAKKFAIDEKLFE